VHIPYISDKRAIAFINTFQFRYSCFIQVYSVDGRMTNQQEIKRI